MTSSPELRFSDADIATLVQVWNDTARDFSDLAHTLSDDEWAMSSPCPGWTVGDIVAHIVGIDSELAGLPVLDHEPNWSALPHVGDNPFSRYTETSVDARRGMSRDEVLAELSEVIQCRSDQLESIDDSDSAPGPMGVSRPLEVTLRMRIFDTWAHEQDIRTTVNRPGNLDSAGAHGTAHTLASSLPFVLGKKVGAAPGTSVRVIVTGAITFDRTVAVADDGRASFVSAPSAPPTATIEIDWPTYVALGCGRITAVDAEVSVTGDEEFARQFLAATSIAP